MIRKDPTCAGVNPSGPSPLRELRGSVCPHLSQEKCGGRATATRWSSGRALMLELWWGDIVQYRNM